GRDAVLPGARLRDDAPLAEPLCQDGLAEGVVELVRARVEEVLALEVDALAGRESLRERQRRRPACVLAAEPVELGGERRIALRLGPARRELVKRRDQRLGDITAAVARVDAARHRAAWTNARTRS